jgi:2-C-methyl-D-erythritol 2,4-cyclodiphosphate synthase
LGLLRQALSMAREAGFELVHVDSTVILERPKLKEHRLTIRRRLAETLGVDLSRISVKFKTAEGLGPVGQGLSAEAQAVVTVCKQASPAADDPPTT